MIVTPTRDSKMATCPEKHTKYQPARKEYVCPKCKHSGEDFYVDSEFFECSLVHDQDIVVCDNCQHGQSAKSFAAMAAKKRNLVKCPTCKGHGLVPKS